MKPALTEADLLAAYHQTPLRKAGVSFQAALLKPALRVCLEGCASAMQRPRRFMQADLKMKAAGE